MSTAAMMSETVVAAHPHAPLSSDRSVGRLAGVLLLVHFAAALIVPFVLLDRVRGSAGFLANAAASPAQMRAAVFLLFAGSALAIGIAIAALPVFRRYSSGMALWLVALAVAGFSLQAVDNAALLSLLSLSRQFAAAPTSDPGLFQALSAVAGSLRTWAHYSSLLVVGSWIFLLHALLFRFRLVPRALAACGLVGSLLQIGAVTVRGLLGFSPVTVLAIPLAPAYVALAVWLIVRGFREPDRLRSS